MEPTEQPNVQITEQATVSATETYHEILAKSYIVYFIFSMIALFIDSRLQLHFHEPFLIPIAIVCFAVGPLLILWAQLTSLKTIQTKHFHLYFGKGPYKYMRNPTQLGILILIIGYVLISASLIFLLISIIAYIVSNVYFRKYEQALEKSHTDYVAYKGSVKKVL